MPGEMEEQNMVLSDSGEKHCYPGTMFLDQLRTEQSLDAEGPLRRGGSLW